MVRIAILRLLESYFRHRWLYLVPILLLTVAGGFYLLTAEDKYIASGVLYVQNDSYLGSLISVRDPSFSWSTPAQASSGQIMDLLRTDAFTRSVIEDTSLESKMSQGEQIMFETIEEVRESIWTSPIGSNQVKIYASNESPGIAMELSESVINRYIQWQINLDRVQSGAAEDFLEELVSTYEAELTQVRNNLEEYLVSHPAPLRGDRPDSERLEIDRLQSTLQMANQRYDGALDKQEEARLATSQAEADIRQTYFVVDSPQLPRSPSTSLRETAMTGIIFVVVGVIFTGVGIVGAALLDRSFRFPSDVDQLLALPVLSVVPDTHPKTGYLDFLRHRSKQKTTSGVNRKLSTSLTEDDALEAAT